MMYFLPGFKNPYGLKRPVKKRGRKTDAEKLAASNHDLFEAELIVQKAIGRFDCIRLLPAVPTLKISMQAAIGGTGDGQFDTGSVADSSDAARSEGRARTADAQRPPLGKPIRDLPPLSAADSEK